jgi:CTP:molybdopterin cytidylyltransferase MocA
MKQHGDSSSLGVLLPPVIILAGGRSERYGSPKGLAKVCNETLLFSHISTFAQVGTHCVVVLGFFTEPYLTEIERTNAHIGNSKFMAEYTVNKTFDLGPFSSIQCGLAKLLLEARYGVFIQPVDNGIVPSSLYNQLFVASEHGKYSVIPEWQGKGGHPVFISADLTARLRTVDPLSEFARLDYQLRAEPIGKVRRLPTQNSDILVNKNLPN